MKGEIWKDIEGFEGKYQVSNMSNVKSLERTVWNGRGYYKTVPERILKARKASNGYLQVQLCKDGKVKGYLVHRLVASAFCENPEGYTEVNHLDENKTNNNADNLEWCSRSYNANYGTRNQRAGKKVAEKLRGRKQSEEHIKKRVEKLKGRKMSEESIKKRVEKQSKPIFGIDKVSGLIVEFSSVNEASRQLGLNPGNICSCLKGRLKSCGGFYWMYKNNNDDTE